MTVPTVKLSELVKSRDSVLKQMKELKSVLAGLKREKMTCESAILEILEQTHQQGFLFNGKLYSTQQTKAYRKRKKDDKINKIESILQHNGVAPDENIVNNVFDVFKHDAYSVETIKSM
jgi:hypothetical protein